MTIVSQSIVIFADHRLSRRGEPNVQINMMTTNPDKQLSRNDLVHFADKITNWKALARHLDLSETDIISIETKNPRNYEEQTFQMLLKWLNQQGYPPSRKDFVQIIAKMDILLAKDINSVFEV